MCFVKCFSVIKLIYSGQEPFSYTKHSDQYKFQNSFNMTETFVFPQKNFFALIMRLYEL
jgi:hypothetical protein